MSEFEERPDLSEDQQPGAELGQSICDRYGNSPGLIRLPGETAVTGRGNSFLSGHLPLLSSLQRRWSNSSLWPKGWSDPTYAWPVLRTTRRRIGAPTVRASTGAGSTAYRTVAMSGSDSAEAPADSSSGTAPQTTPGSGEARADGGNALSSAAPSSTVADIEAAGNAPQAGSPSALAHVRVGRPVLRRPMPGSVAPAIGANSQPLAAPAIQREAPHLESAVLPERRAPAAGASPSVPSTDGSTMGERVARPAAPGNSSVSAGSSAQVHPVPESASVRRRAGIVQPGSSPGVRADAPNTPTAVATPSPAPTVARRFPPGSAGLTPAGGSPDSEPASEASEPNTQSADFQTALPGESSLEAGFAAGLVQAASPAKGTPVGYPPAVEMVSLDAGARVSRQARPGEDQASPDAATALVPGAAPETQAGMPPSAEADPGLEGRQLDQRVAGKSEDSALARAESGAPPLRRSAIVETGPGDTSWKEGLPASASDPLRAPSVQPVVEPAGPAVAQAPDAKPASHAPNQVHLWPDGPEAVRRSTTPALQAAAILKPAPIPHAIQPEAVTAPGPAAVVSTPALPPIEGGATATPIQRQFERGAMIDRVEAASDTGSIRRDGEPEAPPARTGQDQVASGAVGAAMQPGGPPPTPVDALRHTGASASAWPDAPHPESAGIDSRQPESIPTERTVSAGPVVASQPKPPVPDHVDAVPATPSVQRAVQPAAAASPHSGESGSLRPYPDRVLLQPNGPGAAAAEGSLKTTGTVPYGSSQGGTAIPVRVETATSAALGSRGSAETASTRDGADRVFRQANTEASLASGRSESESTMPDRSAASRGTPDAEAQTDLSTVIRHALPSPLVSQEPASGAVTKLDAATVQPRVEVPARGYSESPTRSYPEIVQIAPGANEFKSSALLPSAGIDGSAPALPVHGAAADPLSGEGILGARLSSGSDQPVWQTGSPIIHAAGPIGQETPPPVLRRPDPADSADRESVPARGSHAAIAAGPLGQAMPSLILRRIETADSADRETSPARDFHAATTTGPIGQGTPPRVLGRPEAADSADRETGPARGSHVATTAGPIGQGTPPRVLRRIETADSADRETVPARDFHAVTTAGPIGQGTPPRVVRHPDTADGAAVPARGSHVATTAGPIGQGTPARVFRPPDAADRAAGLARGSQAATTAGPIGQATPAPLLRHPDAADTADRDTGRASGSQGATTAGSIGQATPPRVLRRPAAAETPDRHSCSFDADGIGPARATGDATAIRSNTLPAVDTLAAAPVSRTAVQVQAQSALPRPVLVYGPQPVQRAASVGATSFPGAFAGAREMVVHAGAKSGASSGTPAPELPERGDLINRAVDANGRPSAVEGGGVLPAVGTRGRVPSAGIDVNRVADQVYHLLVRRLDSEKQRKGL